jgi:transcriptional regulator with PAS, ATPase and Fis domain
VEERKIIAVNCSAIPEHLFESELFGYEPGAFTGASKGGKVGKLELANNGTLFLDEIGDMPFNMQSKLLRVLQDGIISRVGSEKNVTTDFRVIAATNKNMKRQREKIQELIYRLA